MAKHQLTLGEFTSDSEETKWWKTSDGLTAFAPPQNKVNAETKVW